MLFARRWWPLALTFLLLSSTPTLAQSPPGLNTTWDSLATTFQQRAVDEGIVGGTLQLVADGEKRQTKHHGFASLDPRRPVDDQTIYHWASITKTLTGIAILQLRDQGHLRLDDAVVDYLPSLREVYNPYGSMEEITIRMLLRHRAGFRTPTWPWGGDEDWHPHEPTRWSQLVAMMPYTKIHVEPGTQFKYSNPGFIFLGQIIEQISGESYEVYVDKHILTPLRMHRSYFDNTPDHLLQERSNNYTVAAGDTTAHGLDFDTGVTVSNGGLNAPVSDMVRYASFLMGHCDTDACENVLDRASLREMWALDGSPSPSADAANQAQSGVGLAFFVDKEWGERRIVGHTGAQKSFHTSLWVDPTADVATLTAFNTTSDSTATTKLMRELQRQIVVNVFPDFQ